MGWYLMGRPLFIKKIFLADFFEGLDSFLPFRKDLFVEPPTELYSLP